MLRRLEGIDIRRTNSPPRKRICSRGVPPSLAERELFYTDDLDVASKEIEHVYARRHLRLVRSDDRLAACHHAARLRDITLSYLDYGAAIEIERIDTPDYVAVHLPMSGRAEIRSGRQLVVATPTTGAVPSPSEPLVMRCDVDSPHLIVRIDQAALEQHLARLTGEPVRRPLRFAPLLDLTAAPATRWLGAIQLLHTEVYYADSLANGGLGIGSLEEFVMSTLLLVQPNNYTELLHGRHTRPGRRAVRMAVDYIEAHLAEPIAPADVARFVGVSVRALQVGFKEELDVSPHVYLRDRRLDRVYADLRDAVPSDGVTVTELALRWGFTHLGRFAELYRSRFGESPSVTLRS